MKHKPAKKRAAVIALSLYLAANVLLYGMIRVAHRSYNTMHRQQLPAAAVRQTQDGYQLTVLEYSATLPHSTLNAASDAYRKNAPFLPCTVRLAAQLLQAALENQAPR